MLPNPCKAYILSRTPTVVHNLITERKLMKSSGKFVRMGLLSLAFILMGFSVGKAQDSEFSFKIVNQTDSTIKKLLVSVDGKKWGFFDIGAGVAPGKTATMVWSKATDNEPCKQFVKAVFADKSESPAQKFDFCEEDLVLEFTE